MVPSSITSLALLDGLSHRTGQRVVSCARARCASVWVRVMLPLLLIVCAQAVRSESLKDVAPVIAPQPQFALRNFQPT